MQRLRDSIHEEMMVAMLDALQGAATACAAVCVRRMQDMRHEDIKAVFAAAAEEPMRR